MCDGHGYIYLNGALLAIYQGSTTHFVHKDHLSSSRVLTLLDGTVYRTHDFLPFGEEFTSASGTSYKFTGKERDTESGLDYFGARHYASTLGRFMSPDEFEGGPVDAFSSNDPLPPGPLPYADITNPQSLNKYAYTNNSPLIYVDKDGHFPVITVVVAILVATAAVLATRKVVRSMGNLFEKGREQRQAEKEALEAPFNNVDGMQEKQDDAMEARRETLGAAQDALTDAAQIPGTSVGGPVGAGVDSLVTTIVSGELIDAAKKKAQERRERARRKRELERKKRAEKEAKRREKETGS